MIEPDYTHFPEKILGLSELNIDELREALKNLPEHIPAPAGTRLCCLQNCHTGKGLLIPELPPDAQIPWRFEGQWARPMPGFAPEPQRVRPLGESKILCAYAYCAIYS